MHDGLGHGMPKLPPDVRDVRRRVRRDGAQMAVVLGALVDDINHAPPIQREREARLQRYDHTASDRCANDAVLTDVVPTYFQQPTT